MKDCLEKVKSALSLQTACQVRVPLVKVLIFSSPTSHRRVNSRIDFARFPWFEKLCGTKFVQGPVYMEVGDPR